MTGNSALAALHAFEERKQRSMSTLLVQIAGAVLLISAQPLFAQHGGRHWGANNAVPYTSRAARDFRTNIKIEASEEQAGQLHFWVKSTAALNKQLEDFGTAWRSRKSEDLSDQLETIKRALEDDNLAHDQLLDNLTGAQPSGLKSPVRKLDQANRALAKALSEITLSAGEAHGAHLLARGLHRAKKAARIEQHEEQRLAHEMGVVV